MPEKAADFRAGFDFSAAMWRLCADVAGRMDEFAHIRMQQTLVTFAQARRNVRYGLQAKLTPMRFEHGRLVTRRAGRQWTVRRLFDGDQEILYILTFYLPRFLDHSFQEKMVTVFHELYHISPRFNGDIRRLKGRYHVHSSDQQAYDRQMARYVDGYLASGPPPDVYRFLRWNFRQLRGQFGGIVGLRVPIPKLIPLPESRRESDRSA